MTYNSNLIANYNSSIHIAIKHFLMMVIVWILLITYAIPVHASRSENMYSDKYASFIIDITTGDILHRENENKQLHPASLTKMMTLLMVFDALKKGDLELHNRVYMSKHAANMSPSKLGLSVGSTIKVEDAIYALVTKSANDIAVALAEKLGGSEDNFAHMMTKEANKIGMHRTHFMNASGLHNKYQVSTARDMALLAHVLLTDYKDYYHYFSTKSFTYQGRTYTSHNKLMNSYEGMDGLKTGYIQPSGFNLVASAVQNNHRLIGVVFGGKTGKSRDAHMKDLLDEAFREVNGIYIAKQSVPIPQVKPSNTFGNAFEVVSVKNEPVDKHVTVKTYDNGEYNVAMLDNALDLSSPDISDKKDKPLSRWSMLESSRKDSILNRMVGEGDYDITVKNRIETGLIAISAQLNNKNANTNTATTTPKMNIIKNKRDKGNTALVVANIEPSAPPAPPVQKNTLKRIQPSGEWSIQIGAYTSRERTENALTDSLNKLPSSLANAKTLIAPRKTSQRWIYRGRIEGYTREKAKEACKYLTDCIAISPNSN